MFLLRKDSGLRMTHNRDERRALAEGLRAARKKAGLTQGRLAERSGIDRATISLIENGHEAPRSDTIQKLAAALHVPPAALWSHPRHYSQQDGQNRESDRQDNVAGEPAMAREGTGGREFTYEPLEKNRLHDGLRELLENERDRIMLGLTPEEEAMLRSIRTRSGGNLSRDFFIDVLIAYRRHQRENR